MSALTYVQASLAGGEISPSLYGRVDLGLYQTGLKTCRNFISQPYGGAINRAGLRYVGGVKTHAKAVRLVPFVYNTEQAYVLEFGDQYMRVFRNGGQIVIDTPSAWGTTTAYTKGQHVSESGTNYYCVESHTSGTFATDLAAGKWHALTGSIVEIPTPWYEGDLPLLKFTQSADVLTVTHVDYMPMQITRTSNTSWTLDEFVYEFGPFDEINEDTAVTVYASAVSGSITITANSALFTSDDIGKLFYIGQQNYGQAWESGKAVTAGNIRRVGGNYYSADNSATTGTSMPQNIEDKWNDGVVTWSFLHPGFGIAEITALADAAAYVGGTTYAAGAEVLYGGINYVSLQASNTGHQPDISPTWWAVATARKLATATVISRIPDAQIGSGNTTYKWAKGAWSEAGGYPGCTTYHQQRHFFAGSPTFPQTIWGSQTADYTNFGTTTPILDSDAVTYPLAGRQVNQVKHLVSLGGALLALTSDSYWTLVGSDLGGALTPSSVQAKVQSYIGSSDVPPATIGNECLFAGDKGRTVRNIGYNLNEEAYVGDDLTRMATHLFQGHTIVDMAYQPSPYSCLWCVRDDGTLLGFTYVKEQKVGAWHRHDTTNGYFENVCVIPEGSEDALYVVVRRTVNGQTKRYVERLEDRYFAEQTDYFFVDSGLSYDGWNTSATAITISGGTTWDVGDSVTLTATSGTPFSYPGSGDVGDAIVFTIEESGKRLAFTILSTSSTATALAIPNRLIPVAYRNTARTDWGFGRKTFTNLDHLEGESVAILTDGNVHPERTVTSGSVEIQTPSVIVHAGLPYSGDLVTLDLAVFNGETIRDRRKIVPTVRVQVESTRGLKMGIPGEDLSEVKQRFDEDYSSPVDPATGLFTVPIIGTWNDSGSVQITQDYPLPAHVLSIFPEVMTGGAA